MASSFTPNIALQKPANGDFVNDWDVPVNGDWDILDLVLGGRVTLNAVGASGTVVLTTAQYQPRIIVVSGTLTANVTYQFPSGVGGSWSVFNNTTGAFTVTFSSGGAGTTVTLLQGFRTLILCDGTNVALAFTGVTSLGGQTGTLLLGPGLTNTGATIELLAGQLPGTATNDDGAPGNVGEYSFSPNTTPFSGVSGVISIITNTILTPGDWDVYGVALFAPGGSTAVSKIQLSVSLTSGFPAPPIPGGVLLGGAFTTGAQQSISTGMPLRVSIAVNTQVNLVGSATFSGGTLSLSGTIAARRVR